METPSPIAAKPTKLKPPLGGLKLLERFLGLQIDKHAIPTDAVFISLDLEARSGAKPVVTQLGFARLDTRDVQSLSSSSDLRSLISVLGQNLRIYGQTSNGNALRNIILVGHSIGQDLLNLRLLDINIFDIAPIITSIDTHSVARYLFPPYSPGIDLQHGKNFSLAGVLSELGCKPNPSEFHNAGNDALYSLYLMLLLAIKHGSARAASLSIDELKSLEALRWVVFRTLERGVSITSFDIRNTNYKSTATLGAGLREIAIMSQFLRDR
ncbi:hypothetical protein QQS21_004375 [Conoideocrella luteorostrata]|uniref:Gfd2/YDR514C-like C-terminal domain-containing protein n=1 Tax=Conoideocrella luteorostrata TaxID=1105319 RepID=A0AAJ0CUG8_9HYPO|nr:hypothetical protein QQS21_004375 [Conoideocrella luteorostrata]